MSSVLTKDPDEVLDYTVDWNDADDPWLAVGDTISVSTWSVPAGITKDSDTNDTTTATIWVSGGSAGVSYPLVNRIVTVGGRTAERTLLLQITAR